MASSRVFSFLSWSASTSRMIGAAMFRQEELVKQPVHLQQAIAVQAETFAIGNQETLVAQLVHRICKAFLNIDAELALKVTVANLAPLQLQDQLADHALLRRERES